MAIDSPKQPSKAKQIYWAVRRVMTQGQPAIEQWQSQTGDRALPEDHFQTLVYYADGPVNLYQLRQWYEPLQALDAEAPVLIVCRSVTAALELLDDSGELGLLKKLAQWPRLVESAADVHEPHRVAFYLHELASDLHSHWNRGKDAPHLRFIIEDNPRLTVARLSLIQGIVSVLASGLAILGVRAAEEMR